MVTEKWVLTVKELHLGHVKETFRAGAVIELDEDNGRLIIDGRRFNDTRDLDVLKRQASKFPNNPWVVPYTSEARDAYKGYVKVERPQAVEAKKKGDLSIIKSDEDTMGQPIDIRETQVSQRKAEAKEAVKQHIRTNGMEIIRGDETVEERIAALKGKNDAQSIGERARLKATGSVVMPIVKDDSLGNVAGSKTISMNAGQLLPTRAEVEARTEHTRAIADARKREVEQMRKGSEVSADEIGPEVMETTPVPMSKPVPSTTDPDIVKTVTVTETSFADEIEIAGTPAPAEKSDRFMAMEKENADLKAQMARLEKMFLAQQAKNEATE